MLTVAEARARIVAGFAPLGIEQVSVAEALGRVLAEDVASRVDQPPVAVSAMDGYAVRAADVATIPVTLKLVGYAQAGGGHSGTVGPGEAVRIFTGAPVPAGADAIVIQENTKADGERVSVVDGKAPAGRFIRPAGLDFRTGQVLLPAGRRLTARDVGLAAAMNRPWLKVRRRPRIAILATGDEVVMPGEPVGPSQILGSNSLTLAAFVAACGGEPVQLGIAPDDRQALARMAAGAIGMDLLLTTGGASVGDHDLIQEVLGGQGFALDFWKIAMRPGKPLIFGRIGPTPVLGLPGNPVSTVVCATLFLRPAMAVMLGDTAAPEMAETARLAADLPANDERQDYLRATLARDGQGRLTVRAFDRQDSSMLATVAHADALIVRAVHAPAAKAGDPVDILRFPGGYLSV
jgi:molybdopterin molybdotransferase